MLWMDETLHHLRNPGMMIDSPLIPTNHGFMSMVSFRGVNGFRNHPQYAYFFQGTYAKGGMCFLPPPLEP